ncbi:hypothetical protein [Clostridium ljungdahlii]|uniref:Uncharacterized protein n=1 Tax=Clostridium ljungdahlii TaxID=1538 RepID=A0A162J682_9CLOT|nr:hypothetical protein [Clostridium ljungdahlii]OAA90895.1 hypothetical protein WY13_00961 [Clostridium ljungdahlii]
MCDSKYVREYTEKRIINGFELTITVKATRPSNESLSRSFNIMARIVKELEQEKQTQKKD